MKNILSETDRILLDQRIAETEAQTRAQIVLATVRRSDNYAEILLKAFAFGTSLTGFARLFLSGIRRETETLKEHEASTTNQTDAANRTNHELNSYSG
jgi:hypothetical protein